ncbi:MAG: CHAT domain-containing protein, partial [Cocleimonas sp.]|nr:CHAT domain-containing protein [Cocleimonas sp.]
MQLSISTQGQQITLSTALASIQIEATDELQAEWQSICTVYQDSHSITDYQHSQEVLLIIGNQLYQSITGNLNSNLQLMKNWLNDVGSHQLEILADAMPNDLQALLLNLPWEIMALDNNFLAADARPYEVSRRIGSANANPSEPHYKDLTLAFMAADPELDSGLQYEEEERAILLATRTSRNLNLMVEESGNLNLLTQRIREAGHCDIAHLSCHGRIDPQRGFVLQLEDEHFGLQEVTARDFYPLSQQINCLFLSACHSADSLLKQSLTLQLASIGIANIIGWDDSVRDSDASYFAAQFYQALAASSTVPTAIALAQQQSLRSKKLHWHLGRCYLAPNGGGKLIARNKPRNPKRRSNNFHVMLDRVKKQVPVASKESFVGRRWQTKQALQSFSDNTKAGVLLYGIGGTGKSSLAARIIDRLEPQYKAVIIYQYYDAFAILTALKRAIKGDRTKDFARWITEVEQQPEQFSDILIDLLEDDFADAPIVLLIDDLEQHILEPLQQGQQKVAVKAEFQATLGAIIEAFTMANSDSCLLLTSRYQFTLLDVHGDELADSLQTILVPDMSEVEQQKHWIALLQTNNSPQAKQQRDIDQDSHYLARIFTISQGNSGLQDVLFAPLLNGEIKTLEQALQTIENYQADQPLETTEQGAVDKYLQRIALGAYNNALSDSEQQLLRILTLFDFPIPQQVILQATPKLGLEQANIMLERLDNFGLINHWQGKGLEQHISCFGLARKVVEPLSREDRNFTASTCAPLLWQVWFREFLQEYQIEPTETLEESINQIKHKPSLGSELEQQRIGLLHRLCISSSLTDWKNLGFSPWDFVSLLERSISLTSIEKLKVSSVIDRLSKAHISKLDAILKEERSKFKQQVSENPQYVLSLFLERFSGRPDLLRQGYQFYFNADQSDMATLLDNIDANNQESPYIVAIKLARTDSQRAEAFCKYAYFLVDQKQDYKE